MRLYGELRKIERQDDGTIIVTGIASTAAVDDSGETVTVAAMRAALPDYMKFGAVREMHGLSAAGTALTASVDDQGSTHLTAHVVDPLAVLKVQTGVYKGLSIGGKVLARDPLDKTIITKLRLNEISLVDRPCNPEAVIGMWKADGAGLEDDLTAVTSPAGDPVAAFEAALDALTKAVGVSEGGELVAGGQLAKIASVMADMDMRLAKLGVPREPAAGSLGHMLKALAGVKPDETIQALAGLVEDLTKRLELAEAMPAPPKLLAGSFRAITKAEDTNPGGAPKAAGLDGGTIAEILAAMSPEDRALAITKAALAMPMKGLPS